MEENRAVEEVGQLKQAIDGNDLDRVKTLMTSNPELHRAPLGYGKNGPLTWVAECRVPSGRPGPARLAMAEWMIRNGSDVHQGGDGPLMRAALHGDRVPMMELLVAHGADVNAEWNGGFPILWAACEAVDPVALRWLLEHGADPNCARQPITALDYLICGYLRSPELGTCVDLLLQAGGTTRYDSPGLLEILRGRVDLLEHRIDAHPELVHGHFAGWDFGSAGARRLLLTGGTLLHLAAEFGNVQAATLLMDRGARVNERAASDQTPIFHSVTQFNDAGLEVTRLLLARGADLSTRAMLPGHYERPHEMIECTPLEYAERFPGEESPGSNAKTLELLRSHEAAAR